SLLIAETARLRSAAPSFETSFWAQLATSLDAHARAMWHFDSTGVADLGYNIIRDSTMARNLSWTLTTGYPTSKIIVWMHSEHIETNPADIRDQNGSTPFHGWATTGALTRAALGSQLYSIGFLAGSGSWQTSELGAPAPSTISLPPSGS